MSVRNRPLALRGSVATIWTNCGALSRPTATFYFDLASPLAYLAAEQVGPALAAAGVDVEWQPVLASGLAGASENESGEACPCATKSSLIGVRTSPGPTALTVIP